MTRKTLKRWADATAGIGLLSMFGCAIAHNLAGLIWTAVAMFWVWMFIAEVQDQ